MTIQNSARLTPSSSASSFEMVESPRREPSPSRGSLPPAVDTLAVDERSRERASTQPGGAGCVPSATNTLPSPAGRVQTPFSAGRQPGRTAGPGSPTPAGGGLWVRAGAAAAATPVANTSSAVLIRQSEFNELVRLHRSGQLGHDPIGALRARIVALQSRHRPA